MINIYDYTKSVKLRTLLLEEFKKFLLQKRPLSLNISPGVIILPFST